MLPKFKWRQKMLGYTLVHMYMQYFNQIDFYQLFIADCLDWYVLKKQTIRVNFLLLMYMYDQWHSLTALLSPKFQREKWAQFCRRGNYQWFKIVKLRRTIQAMNARRPWFRKAMKPSWASLKEFLEVNFCTQPSTSEESFELRMNLAMNFLRSSSWPLRTKRIIKRMTM